MKLNKIIIFILLVTVSLVTNSQNSPSSKDTANIRRFYDIALSEGDGYKWLHDLCFNVGHRLSGSASAGKAVIWAKTVMDSLGLDRVYLQEVMVPHWERGEKEQAFVNINGKTTNFSVCALGNSAGTTAKGLNAEIVTVSGIEQLKKLSPEKVKGKIIYFNRPFDPKHIETFHAYGGCVDQRSQGPNEASKLGAAAVIVRSMTHADDDFPHTGNTKFESGVKAIPALAISTQGSEQLNALLSKNKDLKMTLILNCKTYADTLSYNVIGEIRGSKYPDEYIITGGHLDSWDRGQGAHDDGAGCAQSIDVLRLYKRSGIKPLHSIRAVMFMNEENGLKGGEKYYEEAVRLNEKHVFAVETDAGGFSPRGFHFENNDSIFNLMKKLFPILEPYGLHRFEKGGSGADISPFREKTKCLMAGLRPDSQRYFDYHHANSDTFDKVNKRELELGSASIAALIYLFDFYGQ